MARSTPTNHHALLPRPPNPKGAKGRGHGGGEPQHPLRLRRLQRLGLPARAPRLPALRMASCQPQRCTSLSPLLASLFSVLIRGLHLNCCSAMFIHPRAGISPPKPKALPGLIGVAYQRREAVAFLMWCVYACTHRLVVRPSFFIPLPPHPLANPFPPTTMPIHQAPRPPRATSA